MESLKPKSALAKTYGESSDVVTLARRVFEELLTLQQSAPTDDVLVWIGQALNQDVNLFAGSQLVATSQRDLFDSGLLPTRTPAAATPAAPIPAVLINFLRFILDSSSLGERFTVSKSSFSSCIETDMRNGFWKGTGGRKSGDKPPNQRCFARPGRVRGNR